MNDHQIMNFEINRLSVFLPDGKSCNGCRDLKCRSNGVSALTFPSKGTERLEVSRP